MKEKNTLRVLRIIAKKRKVPSYSRYTKVELARLLEEESDYMKPYTARELRAIARERNVPRYAIYPKSELLEMLGFNSAAGDSVSKGKKARNETVIVDSAEAAGSSGDPIPGKDEISSHEMVAKLSFFCNFGRLYVSEKAGARDSLILEWKTADIISIESRWSDTSETANICIRIKSEQPKVVTSGQNSDLGFSFKREVIFGDGTVEMREEEGERVGEESILEIEFSVCEPDLVSTQDKIKSLDAQYMEKWDVDLDSYESFEGITYLEGECDSILISKRDFQLLQPEKFINDTIVDFYVE
ncbi:hypothetical protein Tco_0584184 [Tanacetum coccineum]